MQTNGLILLMRQAARRTAFVLAVLVAAAAFSTNLGLGRASAQAVPLSVRDYVGVGPSAPGPQSATGTASGPLKLPAPSYCAPCLYYSGDFDATGPNADALLNENGLGVLSQVFTPFAVPIGHTWSVTGLLINTLSLSSTGTHSPKRAGWSIWKGVSNGVAGTLLAAGASGATFTPTGRTLSGVYTEYTVRVMLTQPIALGAGTYFLNMMPQCTDPTGCSGQIFYESDVEDAPPAHRHGPASILDDSFITTALVGDFYADATSPGCSGAGCDLFSFGVIGTCTINSTAGACSF